MSAESRARQGAAASTERPLPPIAEMAVGVIALVVIGGVYLASQIPGSPSLGPAVGLLIAAGAVLAVEVVLLSRVQDFAWQQFRLVFGWSLLGYLIIAGMLEYVFVVDGTRGATLVVLSLMLAIFAVNIPLLFGFSVARYQAAGAATEP